MIEDNVIPLIDPNAVSDEFTSDEYESGYKKGMIAIEIFNALAEKELAGREYSGDDFRDGYYDAIVENFIV